MATPNHLNAGNRVPDAIFPVLDGDRWGILTSAGIFDGRTVIVFALPGAFTPTCTASHLPRFAGSAAEIKEKGVDDIYCLSVNDWFVMEAWREALGIGDEVKMLPDGNGDFTKAMGMLVDKRHLGFGDRSWRYSMIVLDGVIDTLFVEDFNDAGDPFQVSGAAQMLEHLQKTRLAAE